MQKNRRWVIRHERGAWRNWQIVLAMLIALLALALAYFAGVYWGAPTPLRATRGSKIERAFYAQSGEVAKLRARAAFLAQSLALAKESETATRKALFDEQARQVQLEKKLAFYQGIMTPSPADDAVKVGGLEIIPTGRSREYRFQIVLVRAGAKPEKRVSGSCAIAVSGTRNGKSVRLPFAQVSSSGGKPMKFTLRYFANLAGTLRLPRGFTPERVDVSIRLGAGGGATSSYSWSVFGG